MSTDPHAVGERIEQLLEASSAGGPIQRERAEELVRLVVDLYGAGLERLLDLAYEQGALTDALLKAFAEDELVSSLLLVHGLHPLPVEDRVVQALAGQGAQLLEITADGVARVEVASGGHGCSTAAPFDVESAVLAAAPEVAAVEVVEAPRAPSMIPVEALGIRLRDAGVV